MADKPNPHRPRQNQLRQGEVVHDNHLDAAVHELRLALVNGDSIHFAGHPDPETGIPLYALTHLPTGRKARHSVGPVFAFVVLELFGKMPTKLCTRCNQSLSLVLFYTDLIRPDGVSVYCQSCCRTLEHRNRRKVEGPKSRRPLKLNNGFSHV